MQDSAKMLNFQGWGTQMETLLMYPILCIALNNFIPVVLIFALVLLFTLILALPLRVVMKMRNSACQLVALVCLKIQHPCFYEARRPGYQATSLCVNRPRSEANSPTTLHLITICDKHAKANTRGSQPIYQQTWFLRRAMSAWFDTRCLLRPSLPDLALPATQRCATSRQCTSINGAKHQKIIAKYAWLMLSRCLKIYCLPGHVS